MAESTDRADTAAEGWFVDAFCNKHNGYHLQNEDGGTDYVFTGSRSAQLACDALNAQRAVVQQQERDRMAGLLAGVRKYITEFGHHHGYCVDADACRCGLREIESALDELQ